jgi:hypothetical protein
MQTKDCQVAPKLPASVIAMPVEMREPFTRFAFERSRRFGGRAPALALLLELVERHRKELEWEMAVASR